MVRIQQDVPLYKALDMILIDGYAAVPPTDYKKQVRIQMKNEALGNEAFCNAIEREIEDEFSSAPRLDEIEDFINEMMPTLADILDRYDIRKRAKEVCKINQMKEGGAK